ncbi:hypothetical protein MUP77_19480 [Candidatus Bathyarchaeota archaeon]|nr:hypothetical protein [Candidatus Bathyarchaeota archaeon]
MSVDYSTIAIITIFTSFFSGLGQELARYVVERFKKNRKRLKVIIREQ